MNKILNKLFDYQDLTKEESNQLLHRIAQGEFNDVQISSLITVYLMRNISIDEIVGFRTALMELRIPIDLSDYKTIDIVGTGGDGKDTFNVSTCSGFVVAGAGHHVVKHGNYGATSTSGASNVMEQHGVVFTRDNDKLKKSLDKSNFAYLHAPLFNPALREVASARKALAVRSFFNILGPLVNPAEPNSQLLGVYSLPMQRLYSYIYQEFGTEYSVVHSLDGYDEISLTSDFKVMKADNEKIFTPEELGFKRCQECDLYGGGSVEEAAKIFDNILNNRATEAQKSAVIVNAGFAIKTIAPEKPLDVAINDARYSLERGKALEAFNKFIVANRK
ncbi:MAG: anthranilate phosphoribosyltransferase [Bacteroidales bacterium]